MRQTREKNGSKKTRLGMKKEVKQKALPTGWREVRLNNVASVKTGPFGAQLHQHDYVQSNGTPIITVEHLSERGLIHKNLPLVSDHDKERLNQYLIQEGDIVFSRVGSVDRSTLVSKDEDGWLFSGRLLRVRPKKSDVHSSYLNYFFHAQKFRHHMQSIAVGGTMPSINTSILSNVIIHLPPMNEQKAIASLLEKWDTAIEKTEALIAAKKKQFKWLLKTLISDQQDNPEWRKVKLGKVIEDIGDGGTPSRKNSDYFGGGIPWVVIDDITFKIEKTKETLSKLGLSKSTAKIWPKDSVIVSTGATIGHVGIAKIPMATKQGITGIIPKKSITSEYLAYFLLAHTHLLIKYAQGSSFKEIRPETTKKIAFSYPEINLQKDVVSKLNTAQKETDMLRSLAEQYRTQKRGLMQKLLTGEWRRRDESANG